METPTKKTFVSAGAYVEEISKSNPIPEVSTNTAAFIGATKSGPYNAPVLVRSFQEFEVKFGGYISAPRQYLAYAVDLFFQNGGGSAYIVRAAELPVARSSLDMPIAASKLKISPAAVAASADPVPALDIDAALSALEKADDASIIVIPGVCGKDVYDKVIAHCSRMECRFAILDLPSGCSPEQAAEKRRAEITSATGMAAVYYPWLQITDPVTKGTVIVPPSGAVAGIIAAVDTYKGVHVAPANVSIAGVTGAERTISSQEQEALVINNVNAIRPFSGKGILVWGARTVSDDPVWRYISARRLLMYLKKFFCVNTKWAAAGPNDGNLWKKVKEFVSVQLTQHWRAGMLAGATPEESFYVKCGLSETMTPADIMNGTLIIEIGAAAVRPNEFIVFRIVHQCG